MNQSTYKLKRQIMRRVYYTYALAALFHPAFWHGAALSISAGLLSEAIFVRSIFHNFISTPVGNVPHFILGALMNAETYVLLLLGVIVFTMLSLGLKMHVIHHKQMQTA